MARALARGLPAHGWDVTIVSGSRTDLDEAGDARVFYDGLDVRPVDLTPATRAQDPMRPPGGVAPMHPSYEERPNAVDRVFACLDDDAYERQVAAWSDALADAGARDADVLHLHHLTPLNEAAHRCFPDVPVAGHLHGTELLMLERIAEGAPAAWRHAAAWADRMRAWAARCARLIVASPSAIERVGGLLDADPGRCVVVPNGVDPDFWQRCDIDRQAFWRRHLVEEPRGWTPDGPPGSVRYAEEDLDAFDEGPVLLYVGRFTAVKRVPLLIRAFARAQRSFESRVPLVVVGGHPGEYEGEHPLDAVAASGAPDVFLAGWHAQEELRAFFSAADAIVLPSIAEQFGQVLVEGMMCGLPALATRALGASEIVEDGRTGWLVAPDDEAALADALVEIVNAPEERARRAARARESVVARFAPVTAAGALADALQAIVAGDR